MERQAMTSAIFCGKPNIDNSHIRFDERIAASAKPLLYKIVPSTIFSAVLVLSSNAVTELQLYDLQIKAGSGDVEAMCELGRVYRSGEGVKKDAVKASGWTCAAASKGCMRAKGLCYQFGYGVATNMAEAVKCYRKGAEDGDVKSMYLIGRCYVEGSGVEMNVTEALKWFHKGGELGDARCLGFLGHFYHNAKNDAEAVKWVRKGAEAGSAACMGLLGFDYMYGCGVEKDAKECLNWIRRGANAGDATSKFLLGICYRYGYGVLKDEATAVKWFRAGAEDEHVGCMGQLGQSFMTGSGVSKDEAEGMKWFRRAAEAGDEESKEILEKLSKLYPSSFNGIEFGESVGKYPNCRKIDNTLDRRALQPAGSHMFSYFEAEYSPKKPFRKFKKGVVRAAITSGKVFSVRYTYSFDRSKTTAVDEAEVMQTRAALKRKYGEPVSRLEKIGKDFTEKYCKDDLIVELEYTSEGLIDHGKMELAAHSVRMKQQAESESVDRFNVRKAVEASTVSEGGEDAL